MEHRMVYTPYDEMAHEPLLPTVGELLDIIDVETVLDDVVNIRFGSRMVAMRTARCGFAESELRRMRASTQELLTLLFTLDTRNIEGRYIVLPRWSFCPSGIDASLSACIKASYVEVATGVAHLVPHIEVINSKDDPWPLMGKAGWQSLLACHVWLTDSWGMRDICALLAYVLCSVTGIGVAAETHGSASSVWATCFHSEEQAWHKQVLAGNAFWDISSVGVEYAYRLLQEKRAAELDAWEHSNCIQRFTSFQHEYAVRASV